MMSESRIFQAIVRICSAALEKLLRVVFLLRLFFLLLESDRAAGAGPSRANKADDDRATMNGAAWREFCDALKSAGEVVISDGSRRTDLLDKAEGFRYLSRLTRAALEGFVENNDPLHPVLRPALPWNVKMGADNPDNFYQAAPISGERTYWVRGTRGTIHYLGFVAVAGNHPGKSHSKPASLDASQLEVEKDGSFELILSAKPHRGNWLPLSPDFERLLVRQTFLDRSRETPAAMSIECLDGPDGGPGPLSSMQLVMNLKGAALFVNGVAYRFSQWSKDFAKRPNELQLLPEKTSSSAWADPNLTILHGYWALELHEALMITVELPECTYWNFQLNNVWMESLDYENFVNVYVTKSTAKYLRCSSCCVCIVVAHADPAAASASAIPGGNDGQRFLGSLQAAIPQRYNWLSTTGHEHGTMALRLLKSQGVPKTECRILQ